MIKIVRLLRQRDGTTLVNVIAAFTVLMIGLAMLGTCVASSARLTAEAERARGDIDRLLEAYTLDSDELSETAATGTADCGSFTLDYKIMKVSVVSENTGNELSICYFVSDGETGEAGG